MSAPDRRLLRPAFYAQLTSQQRQDFVALEQELLRRRLDRRIVHAVLHTPRHLLVPARQRAHAFVDAPLPIGWGQTISQPSLVAEITAFVAPARGGRALEVGCGSGYQALVLASLGAKVIALERIAGHVARAKRRLLALHMGAIEVMHADGHDGWQTGAPYDAIVVSAAASQLPQALVHQLAPGGRMVVPVDDGHLGQRLVGLVRCAAGMVEHDLGRVRFVPLVRGARKTTLGALKDA